MKQLETLYVVGHVDLFASAVLQSKLTGFSRIVSFCDIEERICIIRNYNDKQSQIKNNDWHLFTRLELLLIH